LEAPLFAKQKVANQGNPLGRGRMSLPHEKKEIKVEWEKVPLIIQR